MTREDFLSMLTGYPFSTVSYLPDMRQLQYARNPANYATMEKVAARYSELKQLDDMWIRPDEYKVAQKNFDKFVKSAKKGKWGLKRMPRGLSSPVSRIQEVVKKNGLKFTGTDWVDATGRKFSRAEASHIIGKHSGSVIGTYAKAFIPLTLGMESLTGIFTGHPIQGIARGIGKTGMLLGAEVAGSSVMGLMAAAGISGPIGWITGAAVAVATQMGGDKLVDAVSDLPADFAKSGKYNKQLSFYNSINNHNDNMYGATLRERSVNLAARHSLNARFLLGTEASLFHR